jgi:phosphatidylglycerophosphatase A
VAQYSSLCRRRLSLAATPKSILNCRISVWELTNAFSPFNSETSRKEEGSAGQPRFANRLILALATWGGVGYLPGAPGTWGTAAALPLWWLLTHLGPFGYALALAVLLAASVMVAGPAQVLLGRPDHPAIVIDEVVGLLVALAGVPVNWTAVLVGFVAFRAFDILKPWPISRLNRGKSGLAVVLDDVAAGVLARLVLAVFIGVVGGGL